MGNKNVKKLIEALKRIDVVRKEKVRLKHAGTSQFYIDIKKAYGYHRILDEFCRHLRKIMPRGIGCIAAGGYGGLPLATALALKYKLKLTFVREKPKMYGRNVWIDGYIPNEKDRIWIVDDVLTTGKSISQTAKTLTTTKARITGCGVIVRRSNQKLKIPCRHLMKAGDLI